MGSHFSKNNILTSEYFDDNKKKDNIIKPENLLYFYSDNCTFCRMSISAIQCLEKHLGFPINKLEISKNQENQQKFKELNFRNSKCPGVPWFYNTKSHQSICGLPSNCEHLIQWAESI